MRDFAVAAKSSPMHHGRLVSSEGAMYTDGRNGIFVEVAHGPTRNQEKSPAKGPAIISSNAAQSRTDRVSIKPVAIPLKGALD